MSVKFSIIIVAFRDYESLNRCVEFVRKREQQDYEIIVWDNTPISQNLESFHLGRVQTFRSGENEGFAKGCNEGAKRAKGEILVFLNPDTEPNGDWLDRMALGFDKGFDAIGPTSDYVAGMQQAVRYFNDPRDFVETKLLIGFCLMIKASTYRELGGMDEECFLGCDDFDISWRLGRDGKKLGICIDVFVHHVGHTSMLLNSEKDRLIKESETYLRSKLKAYYGESVPPAEELWGCKILATEIKPQTLSLCMILKSWDENSKKLFDQMKSICNEVIVFECGEIEDFAQARNTALASCTKDWILWLDGDDEIEPEQTELIKALMEKPGNHTCLQDCHFGFQVQNTNSDGVVTDSFIQSRLFPRIPGVKWGGLNGCHGYVHETIWESACAAGLSFVETNISIKHTGYSDPEVMKEKQKRNLKLLLKEPQNAYILYNIGQSYASIGDYPKAHNYYKDALEKSEGEAVQFVDHIRYVIAVCLYKMGLVKEAVPYVEGNSKPDSHFVLGSCLIDLKDNEKGCDELWAYMKYGSISDPMGTNYPIFRPQAKKMLEEIGVLTV